jgi:hypothetical protein
VSDSLDGKDDFQINLQIVIDKTMIFCWDDCFCHVLGFDTGSLLPRNTDRERCRNICTVRCTYKIWKINQILQVTYCSLYSILPVLSLRNLLWRTCSVLIYLLAAMGSIVATSLCPFIKLMAVLHTVRQST